MDGWVIIWSKRDSYVPLMTSDIVDKETAIAMAGVLEEQEHSILCVCSADDLCEMIVRHTYNKLKKEGKI